jgi:SulP family sulfate permease
LALNPAVAAGSMRSLRGDFLGPLVASLVTIPVEANYGMIALAPLGPAYMAFGAVAAIYCSIIATLTGALLKTHAGLLGGTRPALVLSIAALIAGLAERLRSGDGPDVPLVLAFTMLTLFMTGIVQILLGIAGIGRIVKYLPYPVLAGFVNGAALLILLTALRPLIGLPNGASLSGFLADLQGASPWTLLVGLFTLLVALRPPRITARFPPLLTALFAGTLLHLALTLFIEPARLSGSLGQLQPHLPDLDFLRSFARIFGDPMLRAEIPTLILPAIGLAVLATVETLLTASVVDGMLHGRHHADRELVVQGASNAIVACFGGLTSAAGLARCTNNVRAGARTRLSAVVYAAIGMIMLAGIEVIGRLPLAVMGGLIAAVAWIMIDDWSKRVPLQLLSRERLTRAQRRTQLANYLVMLSVVAIAVISNLINAVFFGVLAAMFLFVRRNSGSVVRRELRGDTHRSLRQRSLSRMRELEREGWRIVTLELEGSLFFGTADQLSREAERVAAKADYLILDFRRVTDIDLTGVRILHQTAVRVGASNCRLLFAAIRPLGTRGRILSAAGIDKLVPQRLWFDTADAGMEWAEDELLDRFDLPEPRERLLDVAETQLGRGLKAEELAILESHLEEIELAPGAPVFRAGETADGLFVLRKGCVSVSLHGSEGRRRLASFAQGVIFGELGLLDGGPRSADVFADEASVALKLTRRAFEDIRAQNPELAAKLLFNLGVEMAIRLRYTNRELHLGSA